MHLVSFSLFTEYNSVYPPAWVAPTTPLTSHIYTPIKLASFEISSMLLKNSNLALHGIYVLCKIKYPIASEGLHVPPRTPASEIQFQDYSSPQQILNPSLHALRGTNKTAWAAKLILTADLAFPVSCASMAHLLMAQHCPFCLNAYFGPPIRLFTHHQ